MAQLATQSIPTDKFLTLSVNLLHRAFIEAARTDAKNIFREIAGGRAIRLTTVQMEDSSKVDFGLALDHSEYAGKLNFGAFRASLTSLLGNIAQALREQKEVTVFNPPDSPASMIFGVTGVTVEEEIPRVMVLGADAGQPSAAVTLRLMYLDHTQFAETQAGAGPETA